MKKLLQNETVLQTDSEINLFLGCLRLKTFRRVTWVFVICAEDLKGQNVSSEWRIHVYLENSVKFWNIFCTPKLVDIVDFKNSLYACCRYNGYTREATFAIGLQRIDQQDVEKVKKIIDATFDNVIE